MLKLFKAINQPMIGNLQVFN